MGIPNNASVYCDANFLVAYGAKVVTKPEVQKGAWILFAKLLVGNCKIVASPLCFDEAWNGVRLEAGSKIGKEKSWSCEVDNLLRKIGICFVRSPLSRFSYNEIMPALKEFTNKLLLLPSFEVIQFPASTEKDGVTRALDNIETFKMKPRDSFHLSIVQMNDVKYIVSRDTDFTKKDLRGIDVIIY